MNVKAELIKAFGAQDGMQFNDLEIDPASVQALMINEVVPCDPTQDFYGEPGADYLKTTLPLFQKAGVQVTATEELLKMGIYLTNAVKTPKSDYTIPKSSIEQSLPYLEKEIALFPNLKVIMLMGDVAKKAFNMITKKETKRNVVPAVSTYKIRSSELYYGSIRIMPSYIMTGGNILIEKSKFEMASQDIALMMKIIA